MIHFTADTHFGHKNIIKYCKRPFKDADEMDAVLIERWNETVEPWDTVYHLGDFAWLKGRNDKQKEENLENLVAELNGTICLILGNHDDDLIMEDSLCFRWVNNLARIRYEGQDIVLCHYAMRVWDKSHFGAWQLFGHTHDVVDDWYLSTDVGVDSWDFRPVSFTQLQEHFAGRECWTHFDKLGENFAAAGGVE